MVNVEKQRARAKNAIEQPIEEEQFEEESYYEIIYQALDIAEANHLPITDVIDFNDEVPELKALRDNLLSHLKKDGFIDEDGYVLP